MVFRLTEEEYDSLKSACNLSGGRTLSDYTRSELLSVVHGNSPDGIIERRFFEINQKLSDLQCLLKHVLDLVFLDSADGRAPAASDTNHEG